MMNAAYWMLLCCMFPFLMTTLGAAAVFLCPCGMGRRPRRIFLGFAAGVMLAASVWSLLNPAIEAAWELGLPGWLPASVGVSVGIGFLLFSDAAVHHLRPRGSQHDHSSLLLQLAVTLHNIPEGMAVGLSAAVALESLGMADHADSMLHAPMTAAMASAIALSLGIGIQNLPEGAAISLPLRQDGFSPCRAFLRGCLSGAVEPIFGILTALLLSEAHVIMPWLLSFAAGAMLYVVVGELIPAANDSGDGDTDAIGVVSVTVGFLLMMVLDVALG